MNQFAKVVGNKVYARMSGNDDWVHVETVSDDALRAELVAKLEQDGAKRADYVADPLS